MVQPGLLGVNSIEEATIGRPALDVEELGHSEVEAIVRGRAGEVLREVPRALDQSFRLSEAFAGVSSSLGRPAVRFISCSA